MRPQDMICLDCGRSALQVTFDSLNRCATCDDYLRRHGHRRPNDRKLGTSKRFDPSCQVCPECGHFRARGSARCRECEIKLRVRDECVGSGYRPTVDVIRDDLAYWLRACVPSTVGRVVA